MPLGHGLDSGRMSDGKYTPNQGVDIGSAGSNREGDGTSLATLPHCRRSTATRALPSAGNIHPQELNNLQANIKNWMNSSLPFFQCYQYLLIGMDNENLKSNPRADAMVIFSINHSTKTITLASMARAISTATSFMITKVLLKSCTMPTPTGAQPCRFKCWSATIRCPLIITQS
ncbi:MAG: hypothetical protein V8S08_02125 [Lachnoclostridium sp.]